MLTGELLRVQAREGVLRPSYVKRDPRHTERCAELLQLHRRGLEEGWTRGRLDQELELLIGDGVDHKLTRGLAKVLSDAATWESEPAEEALALRAAFFDAVGGAPSREAASAALRGLAEVRGCSEEQLRRMLYADRKEEQRLSALPGWDTEALMDHYDLALVQAVLLQAQHIRVGLRGATPGRLEQLFRALRFHQLMFSLEPAEDAVVLLIDGPNSILRQSTRYGALMARWFPHLLLHRGPWELEAKVMWNNRKLTFSLDHTRGLKGEVPDVGTWISPAERLLRSRFDSADTQGWALEPGGGVVELGQDVICPDFTLRKGERRALLEVVGYWRKEWLERRLRLLREHPVPELILAVSTRLDVGKAVDLKGPLILFKEVVPLKELLAAAERCAR